MRVAAYYLGTLLVEEDSRIEWSMNQIKIVLDGDNPRMECMDIKRDFDKMEVSPGHLGTSLQCSRRYKVLRPCARPPI